MRIVNAGGRLGLTVPDGVLDVESASDGRFSADVQAVYDRWAEFREWAAGHGDATACRPAAGAVGPPAPRPRQVFAIGLNYRDHAAEAGMDLPTTSVVVFTKFPASITGPYATVELPPGSVDYETELVVVLGRACYDVPEVRAWDYVAGLTAGQDLSERELQLGPAAPQLCLGKSFPGFAPMGPELVTPDEFDDRDDIGLGCLLNGEQMQLSRTSEMIFGVGRIISYLSSVVRLYAGDVIFTGTPAGTGWARTPKRLLHPGDELVTQVAGIGEMRTVFAARRAGAPATVR